jgi:hypothetical protein
MTHALVLIASCGLGYLIISGIFALAMGKFIEAGKGQDNERVRS